MTTYRTEEELKAAVLAARKALAGAEDYKNWPYELSEPTGTGSDG